MSCTKHFLNVQWEHHSWRKRVTLAENVPCEETSMWGRPVNREFVRCHKEDVCEACGKIRRSEDCICDLVQGDRCTIRRAWIADSPHVTK